MIDKRSWPQYTGFELRHDPEKVRGKGRPKSKRIANEIDEGRKKHNSCRRCGSEGHNTGTCHNPVMLRERRRLGHPIHHSISPLPY